MKYQESQPTSESRHQAHRRLLNAEASPGQNLRGSITSRVLVPAVALLASVLVWSASGQVAAGVEAAQMRSGQTNPRPEFTSDGHLKQPTGYREWIHVGTPLTPNDLNPPKAPFPEFHNVYIHPADYDYYKRTGEFQDGTVLIKELISVGSKEATSGAGYFMGEFIGLEATIKDSTRFGGEPGNWAYFSFGHEYPLAETAPKQPVATCNACHAANAGDDWVFTQYYPVLRAAKTQSQSQ